MQSRQSVQTTENQPKLFLTPAEVAADLRVSTSTVLRLIHANKLPAIAVSERIYRIPAATLERFKAGTLNRRFDIRVRRAAGPAPRLGADETLPEPRPASVTRAG
ncbi:MAG: helix-turn-helix domain-containing protein [Chloroflexi bacterium]|nr:helix-turn-helix domain-containing protein [Chloroflexota bacterium]